MEIKTCLEKFEKLNKRLNAIIYIDKKKILLDTPIKELGVYTINIKIHPEIQTTLKLWVVKE